MNIINTALACAHSGLSVIPTCADKRPACAWKTFTERIMSDREINTFFRPDSGLGIVCGKASGNLELLDFDDGGSAYEPWLCIIPEFICRRLVIEQSPSGGKHVYYRVNDFVIPGNRKLAMKADGHVLIETRGEGGYVKCAPSQGYKLLQGDFHHIPTISPFERQLLVNAAESLEEAKSRDKAKSKGEAEVKAEVEVSASPTSPTPTPSTSPSTSPSTPWADYNERGDLPSLLEAHGWKRVKGGENEHWERPGKNANSTSATWNGSVFYVFSSNAVGFEPNRGYNKFQTYAILECNNNPREAARRLRRQGYGLFKPKSKGEVEVKAEVEAEVSAPTSPTPSPSPSTSNFNSLLHVPGFVDLLIDHTLDMAPYPNRPLAFAGAITMLAHLTGRNFRDLRNLRTNIYLLALADSGVGKDVIRKVNMSLADELGIMPTMADRFASAEGLEDALLIHPASFFQVDEIDTLFAALQEKKDSAMEKIYGAMLQFATSSDTTYAMRKKAIQQAGGKAGKFDKIRARGIREPHLTMLGCAIPKYLYSALSERSLENGLISRCLIIEAGERGKSGTPHFRPFDPELLALARSLVARGGFDGIDLENLDKEPPPYVEPYTVIETPEASDLRDEITAKCETLYDESKSTAEKALWTRCAEKTARLALLYAISENVNSPLITAQAIDWAWQLVDTLTRQMLYQASVYVHDNEFDALRQKALRYLRDYGTQGSLTHSQLLRYLHIDSDAMRRIVETLVESELITAENYGKNGFRYTIKA